MGTITQLRRSKMFVCSGVMETPRTTARSRTGAMLNRHRSNQVVATPPEFIAVVERRFGKITIDLAEPAENAKAG